MNGLRYILALSALLLWLGLGASGHGVTSPVSNRSVLKKASFFPDDFFTGKHTLTIILDDVSTSYNDDIQRKLGNWYGDETQFMTLSDYDDVDLDEATKYSFRYFPASTEIWPDGKSHPVGRIFYMYDRDAEKTYRYGRHSTFYMKIVESYFKSLEKARLEYNEAQ